MLAPMFGIFKKSISLSWNRQLLALLYLSINTRYLKDWNCLQAPVHIFTLTEEPGHIHSDNLKKQQPNAHSWTEVQPAAKIILSLCLHMDRTGQKSAEELRKLLYITLVNSFGQSSIYSRWKISSCVLKLSLTDKSCRPRDFMMEKTHLKHRLTQCYQLVSTSILFGLERRKAVSRDNAPIPELKTTVTHSSVALLKQEKKHTQNSVPSMRHLFLI